MSSKKRKKQADSPPKAPSSKSSKIPTSKSGKCPKTATALQILASPEDTSTCKRLQGLTSSVQEAEKILSQLAGLPAPETDDSTATPNTTDERLAKLEKCLAAVVLRLNELVKFRQIDDPATYTRASTSTTSDYPADSTRQIKVPVTYTDAATSTACENSDDSTRTTNEPATYTDASTSTANEDLSDSTPQNHPHRTPKISRKKQFSRFDEHNLFNNCPDFPEHLKITFDAKDRPDICPYTLREELRSITGRPVLNLTTSGEESFTIRVDTKLQSDALLAKTSMCQKTCTISPHPTFSTSSGLIYIENLPKEQADEFITELVQYEDCVRDARIAKFITPRKNTTTALMLNFNCPTPPKYLDIPFLDAKTKVNPFVRRPMRCYKCQKYGHTRDNCSGRQRCSHCAQEGHDRREDAQLCPSEGPRCFYCEENGHSTGHKDCPQDQKERDSTIPTRPQGRPTRGHSIDAFPPTRPSQPGERTLPIPYPLPHKTRRQRYNRICSLNKTLHYVEFPRPTIGRQARKRPQARTEIPDPRHKPRTKLRSSKNYPH
jgi:hypothetical protein